jgi:hypothetical protein
MSASGTSATLKRCSWMFASGLLSDILPEVLNTTEDAHLKTMSTFEAEEHLQASTHRRPTFRSRYSSPNAAAPGTYFQAEQRCGCKRREKLSASAIKIE